MLERRCGGHREQAEGGGRREGAATFVAKQARRACAWLNPTSARACVTVKGGERKCQCTRQRKWDLWHVGVHAAARESSSTSHPRGRLKFGGGPKGFKNTVGHGLSRNSRDFSLPFPSYAGMLLVDASISSPQVPANRNHGSISARTSLQMEARESDADVFTSGVRRGREGKPEGKRDGTDMSSCTAHSTNHGRDGDVNSDGRNGGCCGDEPTPPPRRHHLSIFPPPQSFPTRAAARR
jgi:hypothetical protein